MPNILIYLTRKFYWSAMKQIQAIQVEDKLKFPQRRHKPLIQRRHREIHTSRNASIKYLDTSKGLRSQTKQLNINVKTITTKFLQDSINVRQLGQIQRKIVQGYQKDNANFDSRDYLFGNKQRSDDQEFETPQEKKAHAQIRKVSLRFYSSTDFVKTILRSDRMYAYNKIIIIKFLRQICKGVLDPSKHFKGGSTARIFATMK